MTHDSRAVVGECLASLPAALEGVDHDVVVVDSGSTDGTPDEVASLAPEARIVHLDGNRGFAAGVNAAVAGSESDAVLVLNPDVRPHPGSLRPMLDALAAPGTGIVVPRVHGPSGALDPSLRREPTVRGAFAEALLGGRRAGRLGLGELVVDDGAYAAETTADWATGAALLVSRRCLDAVGPWEEAFFLYSEETDFALRARDHGFALRFVPAATMTHLGGEAAVDPRLAAILQVNRVRLFRRRAGRLRTLAFRIAVVANALARLHRATARAALGALLFARGRPPEVRGPLPRAAAGPGPGWVCFAGQDWWYHNRAHSDVQLMLRVARTRPVLFVNSIGMRMPTPGRSTMVVRRIGRKARSTLRVIRRPVPELRRFHVLSPLVLPFYGSRLGRRANAGLVRAQVRWWTWVLRLGRPVYFVTLPTAWEAIREVPRRALVYNRSDRHSAWTETDQDYIRSLEHQLLTHADRVVYVNHDLLAEEQDRTGDRGFFLDHGVDLAHFRRRSPAEIPVDVASIPEPRLGFFGNLDERTVDFSLLERVAAELPECQLVLVGDASEPLERLRARPNVHLLGFRRYEEIPAIGSAFGVALMPWQDNEWIRASNPIKVKEYLALGLPIVTTPYPEVEPYRSVVRVAPRDGFVAAIRETLADGGPATPTQRRASVAEADWDVRAATLVAIAEGSPRPG